MSQVHLDFAGPVAILTLDHPEGNRINFAMREELSHAIQSIEQSQARALLLRAEGRDFSLGGDVREWPEVPLRELRPRIEVLLDALKRLQALSIPTVAAVQGRCQGGGLELMLSCDLVIASESAEFGCPEALLGLTTLQGGVIQLAQRIGTGRALEFVFLGEICGVEEMARLNLVNRIVPDEQLQTAAMALVNRLAIGPRAANAATKLLLRAWAAGGIEAAMSILYDVSMPVLEKEEVQAAMREAARAAQQGLPFSRHIFVRD